MKAFLYETTGAVVEINPKNGTDFSLEDLYEHIGCRVIDILSLNDNNRLMVIDDEGKLNGAEINTTATMIAQNYNVIPIWDVIKGNVVICDSGMIK